MCKTMFLNHNDMRYDLNICCNVDVSRHLPFFRVFFQDLVISERLTVRFAHAAQMIKMGPGTAGSSPTSSPGTSRKSRIEVGKRVEIFGESFRGPP